MFLRAKNKKRYSLTNYELELKVVQNEINIEPSFENLGCKIVRAQKS
jgi:hypothetical protein